MPKVQMYEFTEEEALEREMLAQGRACLGNRTPEEFLQLSTERQDNLYRRELVKKSGPFLVGGSEQDAIANEEIINHGLLRQSKYMGATDAGRQIMKKAQNIFYSCNAFSVPVKDLPEFLRDDFVEGAAEDVGGLIREIVLAIAIPPFPLTVDGIENLKLLSRCKDANSVRVQLIGQGMPNGGDLATQEVIRRMAGEIGALRKQFETRLKVEKVTRIGEDTVGKPTDLGKYWDGRSDVAVARYRAGKASVEDMMVLQVDVWSATKLFGKPTARATEG